MMKSIVFGAGCFWCSEAVFSTIEGVRSTQPGYSGGTVENPSYERVCEGDTGHAEVTKVDYDNETITLEELLDIFFYMHDPTSLNRQGEDVGEQYRSVIFYDDEKDREVIMRKLEEAQKDYPRMIVTAVERLRNFYPAEEYHKDYFRRNPGRPYCRAVIRPKVDKIRHKYNQILVRT